MAHKSTNDSQGTTDLNAGPVPRRSALGIFGSFMGASLLAGCADQTSSKAASTLGSASSALVESFTSSGAVTAGDIVCLTSSGDVEVATAVSLSAAGAPLGIAAQTVPTSTALDVILVGFVPSAITGLGAGDVRAVVVDVSTGRLARLPAVSPPGGVLRADGGEHRMGIADATGNVTLLPSPRRTHYAISIELFGAVADDSSPAARVANSAALATAITYTADAGYKEEIVVPRGDYYLNGDLTLDRMVAIRGVGGLYSRSRLMFPPGSGVKVTVSESTLSDLAIVGEEGGSIPSATTTGTIDGKATGTPGISVRYVMNLYRLYVHGFSGTGIEVVAGGGTDSPLTNANQTRIIDCAVSYNGGHGIHFWGDDANACYTSSCNVIENRLCGILDRSFLGNTHVAAHASDNGWAFRCSGPNNRSTFVGCYTEAHTPPVTNLVHIEEPATWIGGSGVLPGVESSCLSICGSTLVSPHYIDSTYNAGTPTEARVRTFLGETDPLRPTAIGWDAPAEDGSAPFRLAYEPSLKIWSLQQAGSNYNEAFYVTTQVSASQHARGIAKFGARSLLLGTETDNVQLDIGASPPATPGTPGDIVWNSQPDIGLPAGWVYTVTNGWRPLALVT